MNILLIGSGGREHALAYKIAASPLLGVLYAAPGNPGIADYATCVALDSADHHAVVDFCHRNDVAFVVIGPEVPLVAGLADDLARAGILAFGPSQAAAQLEGSKGFTKDLCRQHAIPTAAYERFVVAADAKAYVARMGAPIVVKADGLAAGKGVVVAQTLDEANEAIDMILSGAGAAIVVEEFLTGEEASFFALCDGERAIAFASAQDHKRAFDGDLGPNTGGMGAYSPAPILTPALEREVMIRIIEPTLVAMAQQGTPFRGVLYAGLMIGEDGPKLIEYNVRFGDPEAQVLMLRLESDIVPALMAAAKGDLGKVELRWSKDAALCVVMAAKGYPGQVEKGSLLRGLDEANRSDSAIVFQAGTREKNGAILADGGRVLGVAATGATIAEAQKRAYAAVDRIDWPQGFCRRDIGWRAVAEA